MVLARQLYYQELAKYHDLIISSWYCTESYPDISKKAVIFLGHPFTDRQLSYLLDIGLIKEWNCYTEREIPSGIPCTLRQILKEIFKRIQRLSMQWFDRASMMSIQFNSSVPEWYINYGAGGQPNEGWIKYSKQVWVVRDYSLYQPISSPAQWTAIAKWTSEDNWHEWRSLGELYKAGRLIFENSKISLILQSGIPWNNEAWSTGRVQDSGNVPNAHTKTRIWDPGIT